MLTEVEFVVFDPKNSETYPSVCNAPSDVEFRFGFTGGEILIFDKHGAYIGQVIKQLNPDDNIIESDGSN